jgi:pentapeptide MXKDX repeat protein
MTKTFQILTIAAFAGALAGGSAFAQSSSTDAMKKDDHMASGAMTSHDHMTSGAMTHGKKGDHMASGAMTSHDHMKGKKKDDHMSSGAMSSAPRQ